MWQRDTRRFDLRALRVALCGIVVAFVLTGIDASAQCGAKRSTCSECHDGTRAMLPARDPWHDDHAFADLCPSCHGGNGEAHDATAAHRNLDAPLGDANESCASCHGSDATGFRDRYRALRTADAGAASIGPTTGRATAPAHGERGPNIAMTIALVGVGALGAIVVGMRERDRLEKRADP